MAENEIERYSTEYGIPFTLIVKRVEAELSYPSKVTLARLNDIADETVEPTQGEKVAISLALHTPPNMVFID